MAKLGAVVGFRPSKHNRAKLESLPEGRAAQYINNALTYYAAHHDQPTNPKQVTMKTHLLAALAILTSV